MAQKVQFLLVDDIDGGEAVDTVSFALDGVNYEIDLNEVHATELREAIESWAAHARRVGGRSRRGRGQTRATKAASTSESAHDTHAIRAWARSAGHRVSDRGRISADIVAAYNEAHGL